LYILITGCRWQDLPREYGAPTTVWRRLKWWGEAGVWERIWRTALVALDRQGQLDWSRAFLDGSFAPAKKGGEKVGLTKKGKGTKWMLVVDGHGLPLGFHLDSANVAEVKLAEQTLDTISVSRPRGRPKRRRLFKPNMIAKEYAGASTHTCESLYMRPLVRPSCRTRRSAGRRRGP
jgi:hypothetical protein